MTPESDIDFLVQFSEEIDVLDFADNYFTFLEGLEQITDLAFEKIKTKCGELVCRKLENP